MSGYPGLNLGFGIQNLIDRQQRFIQNSRAPVSLRLRNFAAPADNQLWQQLGYILTPASGQTGTTDTQILPPPMTRELSMQEIGQSAGALRFGAREFIICGSFVDAMQSALGVSTPEQVWIGQQTVGLMGYGILWKIASYVPEEAGGKSVLWTLKCNANELK